MTTRTHVAAAFGSWLVAFCLALITSAAQGQENLEPLHDGEFLTGQRMRYAFREVVQQATGWTVRILADEKQVALGTIVDRSGWILTKSSQIPKATQIQLADGRKFPLKAVNSHHQLDLALLKIEASDLPVVDWEGQEPLPGAWMVTVGMPPDYVTAIGVLSVPRRRVPRSDAHGYLGVELARDELPRIKRVFANSGASDAGLREGDVVLEIDRHAIATPEQLIRTLRGYRPGDTLSLRVRRLEEEMAYSVTLMYPPYGDGISKMAFQNQMGGKLSFRRDDFEAVFQHDSVLDPQDCGGPVVNLEGRAMGINIARAGRTETYALPADIVIPLIEELKSDAVATPLSTISRE